jgi:hypothetical protein
MTEPSIEEQIAAANADIQKDDSAASDDTPDFPGLTALGCGYDIFGRYVPLGVKACLFDFKGEKRIKRQFLDRSLTAEQLTKAFNVPDPKFLKTYYSLPERVQYRPRFETKVEYQSHGSVVKEQSDLSTSAGLGVEAGAFAGELEFRYEQSHSSEATWKFFAANAIARYYDLTMANFPSPELHPEQLPVAELFKADLHNAKLAPDKIFDNYGTHYLSAITVGCRIIYSYAIDESKLESKLNAHAALEAKYGEVAHGHAEGNYIATKTGENDAEYFHCKSEGLDPSDDGDHDRDDTQPPLRPLSLLKGGWHDPVVIDLPKNALTPIWYLCTDKKRKKQLQDAFPEYAKKHGHVFGAVPTNLQPLYLLRAEVEDKLDKSKKIPCYRFSKTLFGHSWTGGTAVDRKVWGYVFNSKQEDTVPLYEYYYDQPGSNDYRYETGSWDPYFKHFNPKWKKTSATPIGYVYDGLAIAPKNCEPIYAYFRQDSSRGHLGHFYSTDSIDSRDNAAWRPMKQPDDDIWDPNVALDKLPDEVAKVLDLDGNVHWRVPVLAAK